MSGGSEKFHVECVSSPLFSRIYVRTEIAISEKASSSQEGRFLPSPPSPPLFLGTLPTNIAEVSMW